MTSPKKAMPAGFCKTCRWARELSHKQEPFVLDCQALPFAWQMIEKPTSTVGPDGKPGVEVQMIYVPRPHTEHDFCALYEDRPATEEASETPPG